jgi:anthranilate synthase/aminodeoxychorismate synthase-like glutamine amidotransferase
MAPRIVVVDNYDSFVYNLVQYIGELGGDPIVVRNDAVSVDELAALQPDGILISPGPGRPEDAGISCAVIEQLGPRVPLFGVCLGHQAIGHVFGGEVVRAPSLMHGKTSTVHHRGDGVLAGLPDPFTATRYHSLVIDPASMPKSLEVLGTTTAERADQGEADIVMAVRHRDYPIHGVQFHPESILTEGGHRIVQNFLDVAAAHNTGHMTGGTVVVPAR